MRPFVLILTAALLFASAAFGQASGSDLDDVRRQVVGRPVYGAEGGRIGEVRDLAVGVDGRISSVVVVVTGSSRTLPVPWAWIEPQLDSPTLVVPWNAVTLRWLMAR